MAERKKVRQPSKPKSASISEARKAAGPRQQKMEGLSKTAQRAKWINSLKEHEDHKGQALATRNHDVIVHWAEERKAEPAAISGTEHEGRPGVLRFDFPGYKDLPHVSWDDWFKTFDQRELVFLFQEHLKNGNVSNFFKLDNPQREHD